MNGTQVEQSYDTSLWTKQTTKLIIHSQLAKIGSRTKLSNRITFVKQLTKSSWAINCQVDYGSNKSKWRECLYWEIDCNDKINEKCLNKKLEKCYCKDNHNYNVWICDGFGTIFD